MPLVAALAITMAVWRIAMRLRRVHPRDTAEFN